MKSQNNFEIAGIGEFKLYPITAKQKEFPRVTKDDKEVERKVKEKGISSVYMWVDNTGKEVSEELVYYDIGGKKVQKINRTEKVNSFEIVDRTEIYNLSEVTTAILDCNETTKGNFEKKVKDDCLKFIYKKSSVGTNFYMAYVYKSQGVILMTTGLGSIAKGINTFKEMMSEKNSSKTKKTSNIVEVRADEIEKEILSQMI